MKKFVLVAETGSDISPEMAAEFDIEIVPMHVSFDCETLPDGTFPVEKILEYYKTTGRIPKTSGSTPEDFIKKFDEIHAEYPEAHIVYLAYSALTTCSYQSAIIASQGRDYVTAIDTKQVSFGQGFVVTSLARYIKANPEASLEEVVAKAHDLIAHARMCFMPDNLAFLHAGGRLSNAGYLGARILNIHPCIDIVDGKLVATKKYRGKMRQQVYKLVKEFAEEKHLKKDEVWLGYTTGIADEVKEWAEKAAKEYGFQKIRWVQAACVITTHGGPGAFGFTGFAE